jgi:hypothetical protein
MKVDFTFPCHLVEPQGNYFNALGVGIEYATDQPATPVLAQE